MDKVLYVAMTGAKQTLKAQSANSHNLANASTTGFRADLLNFRQAQIQGEGQPSRINAVAATDGWNTSTGSIMQTGRDLDVAIQGDGFLAVQAPDGGEAYTRAGDLKVTANGLLTTGAGHPVMGESGPVSIPPHSSLTIGNDGTISIVPLGQTANTLATVGRIKLVNPPVTDLAKGGDGLLRSKSGATVPGDASVHIETGALESSNVNITDALVNMIELARQFEMQVKVMHTAEKNDTVSAQLLRS